MLPLRFVGSAERLGPAPVVFVDGSPLGGPPRPDGDLHLSHWPGNRTPEQLRRDLSTEIAFAFLELDESARAELIGACEALVLNHYDTDGVCAAFVLTSPERARRHAALLHEIAAAGDLFEAPGDRALAADAALRNLGAAFDPGAVDGDARKQLLLEKALEVLGDLLEDESAHEELWRADAERHRAGAEQLADAGFDDLVYMDFGVWTARPGSAGDAWFDPGRHAFFGDGRLDRALLLGPGANGVTARFVLGTRSFFDMASRAGSPRPDLEALRGALEALEPEGAAEGCAWRCHDPRGASPELWFGRDGLSLYAEHAADHLAPSRIDALKIKRLVIDAIRATWPLPDDDDEAEEGEDIFAV